jgi:hypothetical protein
MANLGLGLIAHYKCNDVGATTAVVDSSTNNLIGYSTSNVSTMTTTGVINTALSFNGLNQWINVTSQFLDFTTENFSVCFWCAGITQNLTDSKILCRGAYKVDGWDLGISSTSNPTKLFFNSYTTGSNNVLNAPVNFYYDNSWNHWALVRTGTSTGKWYKNGVLQTASGDIRNMLSTSKDLHIACDNAHGTSSKAKVNLDDIRFYNYALSGLDVYNIYNGGNGTESETNDVPQAIGIANKLAVIP